MLPVLVHCGPRPWRGRCDLRQLVDLAIVPDALRDEVVAATPDFACTVHDFAQRSEVEIRAMALTLPGLWAIAQLQFLATAGDEDGLVSALGVRDTGQRGAPHPPLPPARAGGASTKLLASPAFRCRNQTQRSGTLHPRLPHLRLLADWADVMRRVLEAATGRQALAELCSYLLKVSKVPPRRLQVVVERAIGRAAMKKFASTYDQLLQEGEARGIAKGKADLVLRQLRRRFGRVPATIAAHLRTMSAGELDRIAERLLDAASLRELFESP